MGGQPAARPRDHRRGPGRPVDFHRRRRRERRGASGRRPAEPPPTLKAWGEPVRSRLPPPTTSSPAVTLSVPTLLPAPESVSVPAPTFVSVPVPATVPAKVVDVLSLPTVKVAPPRV